MTMPVDRSRTNRLNKSRSKDDERDIARRMGGTRHKADVGGGEDVSHPEYCIQVKGGGTVVTQVMRDGMASAKAAAVGNAKLPCVVLVDRRGTRLQRYVVFELDAFCSWHGYGEKAE